MTTIAICLDRLILIRWWVRLVQRQFALHAYRFLPFPQTEYHPVERSLKPLGGRGGRGLGFLQSEKYVVGDNHVRVGLGDVFKPLPPTRVERRSGDAWKH